MKMITNIEYPDNDFEQVINTIRNKTLDGKAIHRKAIYKQFPEITEHKIDVILFRESGNKYQNRPLIHEKGTYRIQPSYNEGGINI